MKLTIKGITGNGDKETTGKLMIDDKPKLTIKYEENEREYEENERRILPADTQKNISKNISDLNNPLNLKNLNKEDAEKYLVVRCGELVLGIRICEVKQIIRMPQITPLVNYPSYIRGVTCLHGEAIAIMDLRRKLGFPEEEYSNLQCVVILSHNEYRFGVIVDKVDNIENICIDDIFPLPKQREEAEKNLIGIVGSTPPILLVDVGFFFNDSDANLLLHITDNIDGNEEY